MSKRSNVTEHAGPKRGRGAHYGRKRAAKRDSNKRRRHADTVAAREADVAGIGAPGPAARVDAR